VLASIEELVGLRFDIALVVKLRPRWLLSDSKKSIVLSNKILLLLRGQT